MVLQCAQCARKRVKIHDLENNFTTHLRTSSTVTILNSSKVQGQARSTSGTGWIRAAGSKSTRILVILSEKNSTISFASSEDELLGRYGVSHLLCNSIDCH